MVEIRNLLTFELLTVLQYPNHALSLTGPPAYSPDGWSLACAFFNGVVIWDIQTGGVVRVFGCCYGMKSLVWSLDGRKIAVTTGKLNGNHYIETYDVASGAQLFTKRSYTPHLWAYKETFRFVTDSLGESRPEISISEIGPTLTKIESVSLKFRKKDPTVTAFSPSTSHVSFLNNNTLRIMDIRESNLLLQDSRNSLSFQFSLDGNLFAASDLYYIRIWKYASGSYTLWRELPFHYLPVSGCRLQFSPTSVSILLQRGNVVQVWPLDDSITLPKPHRPCKYAAISPSGHYIATADRSTITIIDVHSQSPPWLVDTGAEIKGLVITGNVLLAASSGKVVAWLLTEEGVGNCHSIWTISAPFCDFSVEGQVGVIQTDRVHPFIYHTETGDFLDRVHEPQQFSHDVPPEDDWLISNTGMREAGWIMDPRGRHRLWVPVEWRQSWSQEDWNHDITTLFISSGGRFVIIKF